MNKKVYVALALLVLVVIFIAQNTSLVNIQFLVWNIEMSRSLMIFFVLAVGVALGWILAGHFHKKRH